MTSVRVRNAWSALGLFLLSIYVVWNVWWLAAGRIPPSMLTWVTGIPSPTTGGTRSFLALVDGNVMDSLYYNPMTLPFLLLFVITVAQVLRKGSTDNWLKPAWIGALSIAWVIKLLSPSETW